MCGQGVHRKTYFVRNRLDAATFATDDWEDNPGDEKILTRLLALNRHRAGQWQHRHIDWPKILVTQLISPALIARLIGMPSRLPA